MSRKKEVIRQWGKNKRLDFIFKSLRNDPNVLADDVFAQLDGGDNCEASKRAKERDSTNRCKRVLRNCGCVVSFRGATWREDNRDKKDLVAKIMFDGGVEYIGVQVKSSELGVENFLRYYHTDSKEEAYRRMLATGLVVINGGQMRVWNTETHSFDVETEEKAQKRIESSFLWQVSEMAKLRRKR